MGASKVTIDMLSERVKGEIFCGRLRPGTQLGEAAMAEKFQVSRNTLREVFRNLAGAGLLEYHPHRGVFVKAMTVDDARDLLFIREMICTSIVGRIDFTAPATRRAVRSMKTACRQGVRYRDAGRWREVVGAVYRFHQALFDATGSTRISSNGAFLLAQSRMLYLSGDGRSEVYAPLVECNEAILSALCAGSTEEATKALIRYFAVADACVKQMFHLESEETPATTPRGCRG